MQNLNESLNESLQAKYPHLELSVLSLSQVKKNNEYFRIDSEPFKKSNLSLKNGVEYIKLSQIATINPSKTELQNYDENSKVTFLSMQNLGSGFINEREEGTIKDLKSGYTYFAENDILVAKITPCMEHGKCAIATNLTNKIGFGSTEFNVFRVKNSRFLQEFLFCYLHRENVRKIATDNMVGTSGRQRVPTAFYENLPIPILPLDFQREIQKLVQDSHRALEDSKALYKEAENLLCKSLGLDSNNPLAPLQNDTHPLAPSAREGESLICTPQREGEQIPYHLKRSEVSQNHYDRDISVSTKPQYDKLDSSLFTKARNDKAINSPSLAEGARGWVNPHNDIAQKYLHLNISIRSLSQSYGKSGRLDSEYYQAKYDAIERKIKDYQGGYFQLQPSQIKDSNFTPKAQEKYRYIELANIGSNGNINEPLEDLGENLPTRARRKVKTGDFIMSSIEGSLTSCALITPEFDNCLVSTGFYVLNSAELNSETLLVLFKCAFFQEYLKKFPSGTILTAISKDELQNILIPKIDTATQEQIAQKIQKSFALRKESKDLLESAKAKVEQAIQNNAK